MSGDHLDRSKVRPEHLERAAFVYVRQSSAKQVRENVESGRRQYGFADQARTLGWSEGQIVILDEDQGRSGATPQARPGFGRLIGAVARAEVGIVMSLEVSRLSRNDTDWHHLVHLCRWTATLIADEHGVYDPTASPGESGNTPQRPLGQEAFAMPKARIIAATLALAALCASFTALSHAQSRPGLARLYILNCGEGVAGDISRWSPGVNEGKSMDFVDNCYLIKHAQGWMLWDTGVADAIAAMPDGQKPADPRATHWKRPKTLGSQLEQLGVKPSDITYVAVSHSHPDHTGNVEMFPRTMLLVQKAEYEWPGANNVPRFKPEHPVTKLEGDKHVFGDGSVTIISTPGHTPGHQSLLVKLPKTGALLLSGDAVHFQSNWENRRVPAINSEQEQTRTSMQRMADILAKEKATLWINHDKAQRDTLKMAPEYYE